MRQLLAILLLTIFTLPYASVFFAPELAETGLPACCRKSGKHHCALMQSFSSQPGERINTVSAKCPYTPAVPALPHLSIFSAAATASVFAELLSHPAVHAQTEAKYRISSDRSRQKRGPPSLILM